MKSVCDQASVLAVKVLRTTMEDLAPLLEANKDWQVVYQQRDPRAILQSTSANLMWATYSQVCFCFILS
mgnify:CR=1 FL=1